jgi:chromosome segregation ATPase
VDLDQNGKLKMNNNEVLNTQKKSIKKKKIDIRELALSTYFAISQQKINELLGKKKSSFILPLSMPFEAKQKDQKLTDDKNLISEENQKLEEALLKKALELKGLKESLKDLKFENEQHLNNINLKAMMIQELATRVQEKDDLIQKLNLKYSKAKKENERKDDSILSLEKNLQDLQKQIETLTLNLNEMEEKAVHFEQEKAQYCKDQNREMEQNQQQLESELKRMKEQCQVREEQLERAICQLNLTSQRASEFEEQNRNLSQNYNELVQLYKEMQGKLRAREVALKVALEDKAYLLQKLGYMN